MSAEQRIAELLDRWLASVELHAKYLELDAEQYARVQDWPKHQRPSRWVVELARARLLELQRHLDERRTKGDVAFAESLELMAFLTTLRWNAGGMSLHQQPSKPRVSGQLVRKDGHNPEGSKKCWFKSREGALQHPE